MNVHFHIFTGFNWFEVKKFMKENIRKLLADFSWLFAILPALVFAHVFFKLLELEKTEELLDILFVIWNIFTSAFLFMGCNLTPAKLLFSKDTHMKWGLLLAFLSIITLTQCYDEVLECIMRFDNITKYFRNHGFALGSSMFVKIPSASFIIGAIFIAPFVEEFLFRYYFYSTMKVRYESISIAMILSSLIFALLHISANYSTTAIVMIFFHGILFAYIYEKTKSILPSMLLHAFNNALAVFFNSLLFAYSVSFALVLVLISLLILLIALVVFVVRKILARKIKYVEVGGVIDAPFIPQVTTTIDEVLTERCGSGQVDDTVDGTPNPPQVKTELDTQK